MNIGFFLAAAVSAVTFCVHLFAGGVHVVRPLLAAQDLTPASRWLNYYCWHIVTIYLAAMTAVFALAATGLIGPDAPLLMIVLAVAFSILCVAVALKGGIRPWRFPASYLFLMVAAAGAWGVRELMRPISSVSSSATATQAPPDPI